MWSNRENCSFLPLVNENTTMNYGILDSMIAATAEFAVACAGEMMPGTYGGTKFEDTRTTLIVGFTAKNKLSVFTDAPEDFVAQTTTSQ